MSKANGALDTDSLSISEFPFFRKVVRNGRNFSSPYTLFVQSTQWRELSFNVVISLVRVRTVMHHYSGIYLSVMRFLYR